MSVVNNRKIRIIERFVIFCTVCSIRRIKKHRYSKKKLTKLTRNDQITCFITNFKTCYLFDTDVPLLGVLSGTVYLTYFQGRRILGKLQRIFKKKIQSRPLKYKSGWWWSCMLDKALWQRVVRDQNPTLLYSVLADNWWGGWCITVYSKGIKEFGAVQIILANFLVSDPDVPRLLNVLEY